MKFRKFDCMGRVPASISDLDNCDICLNETVCMSMQGIVTQAAIEETEEKYKVTEKRFEPSQQQLSFK